MKDGGPAFPLHIPTHDYRLGPDVSEDFPGMSLRDYFAAAALQGVLAEQGAHAIKDDPRTVFAAHATVAYALADAMLAEREK